MSSYKKNIIIYSTVDGRASVSLYAQDGMVWMNQNQIAELFETSKQNLGQHIANILKEEELQENIALTSWKGSIVRKQDVEEIEAIIKTHKK